MKFETLFEIDERVFVVDRYSDRITEENINSFTIYSDGIVCNFAINYHDYQHCGRIFRTRKEAEDMLIERVTAKIKSSS